MLSQTDTQINQGASDPLLWDPAFSIAELDLTTINGGFCSLTHPHLDVEAEKRAVKASGRRIIYPKTKQNNQYR